jgi:hypothetical protein
MSDELNTVTTPRTPEEVLAEIIHADCIREHDHLRASGVDITQHGPDAHLNDAQRRLAALAERGYVLVTVDSLAGAICDAQDRYAYESERHNRQTCGSKEHAAAIDAALKEQPDE